VTVPAELPPPLPSAFDGVLHQKGGRCSDAVIGDPAHGAAEGLRRLAQLDTHRLAPQDTG